MFISPILPENDLAKADLERAGERLAMLRRLSQWGMDLAQALRDGVVEGVDAPLSNAPGPDPALSFTRVARAVRQSLALEARLEDQRRSLGEKIAAAAEAGRAEALERAAEDRRKQVSVRRQAVWTVLRPEIEEATSWDEAEDDDGDDDDHEYYALTNDLHERLADAAEHEDFLAGPVETIIDEIRQALGLAEDLVGDAETSGSTALRAPDRAGPARMIRRPPIPNPPISCADVAEAWRRFGETEARADTG